MSVHNLSVVLTGNATSLKGAMNSAGREVSNFSKEVEGAGKTGSKTGQLLKMGLATAAVAVGVALAYSVAQAAAFDREMRNVQSITKVSDAELKGMGQTLIGMSTTLPQSAKTLAEGLYNIASSGFAGADGLKVLKASAEAASAGLTTTEVSAKAITAVLNAYGRTAEDATDVSDVLFQTVNLGVISFEELAGTIGDVVGTAAAATVGIDEVGSAIATMTLSGISGAEAGTSLNRLLQSMIDPSDSLAQALNDVGYESGYSALQTDSLAVVMEKLRVASGGNIETLLKWFPEIRAARGALSLMSNEGKNYIKVAAGIEDADARAGATRAALKEQMKAVTAQFEIFKNKVNAAAITVGTELLPIMTILMEVVTKLAKGGMAVLQEAVSRLEPTFTMLVERGEDVAKVAKVLYDTFGPVVAVLGSLAGLAVIGFLNGLSTVLTTLTGLFAEHPALIQAVAVVLGGVYLSSVLAATGATAALAAETVILQAMYAKQAIAAALANIATRAMYAGQGVMALVSQFSTGPGAISSFKSALSGLGPALSVGIALVAVTMAVKAFTGEMKKAEEQAKEWSDSFAGDFDPAKASLKELDAEIARVSGAADEMQSAADKAINPFLDKRLKEARDNLKETVKPMQELRDTADMIQERLGVSAAKALRMAQDTDFMAKATDNATGEFDKEAAAALMVMESLGKLSDELRGMFDPLFGAQDAMRGLKDAQQAVTDAIAANKDGIDDNNVSQEEMNRLNEDAVKAALDYQGKMVDLKAAIADGTVSVKDAIGTLQLWVDQGLITQGQADLAAGAFGTLGTKAGELDGKNILIHATADTAEAKRQIDELKTSTDFFNRVFNIEVRGPLASGYAFPAPAPSTTFRSRTSRWGSINSYARGGIQAHVQQGERIRYAEPETGGEAFIPRLGDAERSSQVLTEAASWYGFGLVKMAHGGITSYGGGEAGAGGTTVIAPEIHVHVGEDVTPMGLARVERAAKRAASDAILGAMRRPLGGGAG